MNAKSNVVPIDSSVDLSLRRAIMRAIDESYVDAKNGYLAGTTDQSIANKLSASVDAVRKLREENFGPLADHPIIGELAGMIERFAKQSAAAQAAIDNAVLSAMECGERHKREIDANAKQAIAKIERAKEELRRK